MIYFVFDFVLDVEHFEWFTYMEQGVMNDDIRMSCFSGLE